MQRLEVSGAVRPLQWSLGVKGLILYSCLFHFCHVDMLQIQLNSQCLLRVPHQSTCPNHEFPKVYYLYCSKRPVYFTQYIFMQYPTPQISPFLGTLKMFSRLVLQCTFFPQKSSYFIFGRASNLYLCLYNQLFALFHYVFKFLTP